MLRGLQIFVVIATGLTIVNHINLVYNFQSFVHEHLVSVPQNGTEYDFVVVGAGSAGSVVAGRLGEEGYSVLLIEAGGPSHWMQGVPMLPAYFMHSP